MGGGTFSFSNVVLELVDRHNDEFIKSNGLYGIDDWPSTSQGLARFMTQS